MSANDGETGGKTPRTPAQRSADYRKTFPRKANARRCDLIEKQHSGFTPEESARRFDQHPGWEEECKRRYRANLTDAERAELAECKRIVDEWWARSPMAEDRRQIMDEMAEVLKRITRQSGRDKAEPDPTTPTP